MNYPEIRYLERLADLYPTIASASTEVINMEAILNLPKGTEHFLTDIHGEDEAFAHVLKNGSGSVRRKVNEVFGNTLSHQDKRTLATLIYYPRTRMSGSASPSTVLLRSVSARPANTPAPRSAKPCRRILPTFWKS